MSTETSKEILEARKKMAEQFGDVKLGGKGNNFITKDHKEELNQLYIELVRYKTRKFLQ